MKHDLVLTTNEKFAHLICDALSDYYNGTQFRVEVNGSITWRVVVMDAYSPQMLSWARGYLAALKAHCTL